MNENSIAIPSNKKYTGEKINLSKEALEKDIAQIKELDTVAVREKLMDYINHQPGKDKGESTFEMIALYQRALQLLGYDIAVDGLFGGNTLTTLKTTQRDNLGFQGKDIDGLPGPKTTVALIEALQKGPDNSTKEAGKPVEEAPAEKKKTPEEEYAIRLQKADKYLTSKGYTPNDDGTYTGPDRDITITIRDYGVDHSRFTGKIFSRALGNWKLSVSEIEIKSELRRILNGRSGGITNVDKLE